MSHLNYVNLIPQRTRWRNQVEGVLEEFSMIHPRTPLENHVSSILRNPQYKPVMILRSFHEGAFGDSPHFNIRTDYSAEIHVYAQYHKGHLHYLGMTE